MDSGFFFITRRVSEKTYLERAVLLNTSVITAIGVKDYKTAVYYIPRVAENYLKFYIAKRGFIPPRSVELSHLKPSLQDGLTDSGKDIVSEIYEIYREIIKYRWSHLRGVRINSRKVRKIHKKLKIMKDLINEL